MTPRSPWHISPLVDTLAYGWSWLPPLLLLGMYGPVHPDDYLLPFIGLVALSFAHRHATIPYVALDRATFRRAPYAFTLFPALLILGFITSIWGYRSQWPAGSLGPVHATLLGGGLLLLLQLWATLRDGARLQLWLTPLAMAALGATTWAIDLRWPTVDLTTVQLLEALAIVAGVWNVWHVLQQKYGIFRMYAAKAEGTAPPWVDRFLLFGTLPLAMVGAARHVQPIIDRIGAELALLQPLVDVLQTSSVLTALSVLLAATAIAVFVRSEVRQPSIPRLTLATGVIALHGSFWLADPVKVYIAYATSHAIEYLVFLWAFQRRQYATPSAADPLLGRIVRKAHGLYWVLLVGGVGAAYIVGYHSDDLWLERPIKLAGLELWRWVFVWGIWQSMAHFYWDSFLWKMRRAEVRASL